LSEVPLVPQLRAGISRDGAIIKATLGGEETLADNLTWEKIQGLLSNIVTTDVHSR
jgi:hypothetical protein